MHRIFGNTSTDSATQANLRAESDADNVLYFSLGRYRETLHLDPSRDPIAHLRPPGRPRGSLDRSQRHRTTKIRRNNGPGRDETGTDPQAPIEARCESGGMRAPRPAGARGPAEIDPLRPDADFGRCLDGNGGGQAAEAPGRSFPGASAAGLAEGAAGALTGPTAYPASAAAAPPPAGDGGGPLRWGIAGLGEGGAPPPLSRDRPVLPPGGVGRRAGGGGGGDGDGSKEETGCGDCAGRVGNHVGGRGGARWPQTAAGAGFGPPGAWAASSWADDPFHDDWRHWPETPPRAGDGP
jgi:hypothetical protein